MTRRSFAFLCAAVSQRAERAGKYQALVRKALTGTPWVGLQVGVIRDGRPDWTGAFGWADAAARVPMAAGSILNIASVSKLVTGAAALRLFEQQRLQLDASVNRYLRFSVVHPKHPRTPVTTRQLLAHTSSIADGPAYAQSYHCGPASQPLAEWVRSYLHPEGDLYEAGANFHAWAPGSAFRYSNVAYGLAGCIVEAVSGLAFEDYCREHIFFPLGMNATSWRLDAASPSRHAVPYTLMRKGQAAGRVMSDGRPRVVELDGGTFAANCRYSFPNYPDGGLRTNCEDFSRFACAFLGGGAFEGRRILRAETVSQAWSPQFESASRPPQWTHRQGLTWRGEQTPHGMLWGHTGGDPGVSTVVQVMPEKRIGVILFANSAPAGAPLAGLVESLLRVAAS